MLSSIWSPWYGNALWIECVTSKSRNWYSRGTRKFEGIDEPLDPPFLNPGVDRLAGYLAKLGNRGHSAGELNCGGHHIGFDASKALGASGTFLLAHRY